MNTTRIISVILPVYNGDKYLREAIDSVLAQTHTNFELIIINDASTDDSEKTIVSYDDPRIIYVKNEINLGLVETLNKGLSLAKGDYIARMDQDDICRPQRFFKQINFLDNNLDIAICGSWIQYFGASKKVLKLPAKHEDIKIFLLYESPMAHPSIMARKEFFKKLRYDNQYTHAEDYGLWVEAIDLFKFENLTEPLLNYRVHNEQTGSLSRNIQDDIGKKLKFKLFQKISADLKFDDINCLFDVEVRKISTTAKIEKAILLVLEANKKTAYFDDKLFKTFLGTIYIDSFKYTISYSISTFIIFSQSPVRKLLTFPFWDLSKFTVKCLIKYNKGK